MLGFADCFKGFGTTGFTLVGEGETSMEKGFVREV